MVPVRRRSTVLRLVLVGLACLAATGCLPWTPGVDPTVGPEHPVSDPIPGAGGQQDPAVAWNGSVFLAVWEERSGGRGSRIMGTMVGPDGSVRSRAGMVLAETVYASLSSVSRPLVASNGSGFLVTWTSWYRDITTVGAAVVDATGAARRTQSVSGTTAPRAVTSDGSGYLVVSESTRESTIHATRIDAAGNVVGRPAFPIGTGAEPDVAWNGSNHLVVWKAAGDVAGVRVGPTGDSALGAPFTVSNAPGDRGSPTVASDGSAFLAAWTHVRSDLTGTDIVGARITGTGGLLDAADRSLASGRGDRRSPDLTFDGSNYALVFEDAGDVFSSRVSTDGTPLGDLAAPVSTAPGRQAAPAAAVGAPSSLVVWADERDAAERGSDVYAARWSAGAVHDPAGIFVSRGGSHTQVDAEVAWNGSSFLAAWHEEGRGIVAARVNRLGQLLDGSGIVVAPSGGARSKGSRFSGFDVAWNGRDFVVVWSVIVNDHTDERDLFAARISPAGTLLDPLGIAIAPAASFPAEPVVAAVGSASVVAWIDRAAGTVTGARLAPDGSALDPSGFPVGGGVRWGDPGPAIASNGTDALVTWTASSDSAGERVLGALVGGAGPARAPIAISPSGEPAAWPAVASDGSGYLVVWQSPGADLDVRGARVGPSGDVRDRPSIAVSSSAGMQTQPTVAFDSGRYLVAWVDHRRFAPHLGSDVFATLVSPGGVISDPDGFLVNPTRGRAPGSAYPGPYTVAASGGPEDDFGVVDTRVAPEAPYDGASRVFLRMVSPN